MYIENPDTYKDATSIIEGFNKFTKREIEVLRLIGNGFSTKQIAGKLFIAINTVETHRRHLLEKMRVKNSMELVKQATQALWIKEQTESHKTSPDILICEV